MAEGALRVFIVCGTRLYREALADILRRVDGLEVVRTAAQLPGSLVELRDLHPDIVLLDAMVPGPDLVALTIMDTAPGARVVAFDVADVEESIVALAEAGVSGFVMRGESLNDLLSAVENAGRGETTLPPAVTAALLSHVAAQATQTGPPLVRPRLTLREMEILHLIEEHTPNREIAERLGITLATVKNHVHNILAKLNVRSRAEARAWIEASSDEALRHHADRPASQADFQSGDGGAP